MFKDQVHTEHQPWLCTLTLDKGPRTEKPPGGTSGKRGEGAQHRSRLPWRCSSLVGISCSPSTPSIGHCEHLGSVPCVALGFSGELMQVLGFLCASV